MNRLITSLRAHTQSQHERLESVTSLPQSLESAEDLRRVLCTFLGFYTALDPALHESKADVLPSEITSRPRRSHVLRRDLIAMGLDECSLANVPICTKLPTMLTPYHRWGVHYVVEGSALGGRVVRSHMKKHPELERWVGVVRFFSIYGSETTSHWKNFISELEELNPSPLEHEQILEGAQSVFATLIVLFQEQR